LGCDVVVEFGLGEGLVVRGSGGQFLNLAGLGISDSTNPRILAAFVAYFDCTGDFAVNLPRLTPMQTAKLCQITRLSIEELAQLFNQSNY
jgi:hypothetical protein